MNLKKLKAFMLVLDKGSFSEAAEMMDLSQPAISQQVKSLEEDLGVSLLNRSSSTIKPTAAGRYVYNAGFQLLKQWKDLEEGVKAFHGTLNGTLAIGASTVPGNYMLPRSIGEYCKAHPNVDVVLEIGDSEAILSKMMNRQLDAAVISFPSDSPDLDCEMIAEDSLVLISSHGHPLVTAPCQGDPCELVQYEFVIREKGSGTRKAMDEWLTRCGVDITDLRIVAQFSSNEALIAAVEAGVGLSFVSQLAAQPAVKAGRIQIVSVMSAISRKFYLIYPKARKDYPTVKEWIETLRRR